MRFAPMKRFWKKRFLLLVAGFAVLAFCGLLFVRGRNSAPIGATGGAPFQNFTAIKTPFYLQRDVRWKDETIGGTGESLNKVGCTVSSLAMALDSYGFHVTPSDLNAWFKTNNGYTWSGWLKWNGVKTMTGGKVVVRILSKPTHRDIDDALEHREPVMVKVLIRGVVPHWVLIVGKQEREYLIRDPLGDGKTMEPLSKYGSEIYGVRIISAG